MSSSNDLAFSDSVKIPRAHASRLSVGRYVDGLYRAVPLAVEADHTVLGIDDLGFCTAGHASVCFKPCLVDSEACFNLIEVAFVFFYGNGARAPARELDDTVLGRILNIDGVIASLARILAEQISSYGLRSALAGSKCSDNRTVLVGQTGNIAAGKYSGDIGLESYCVCLDNSASGFCKLGGEKLGLRRLTDCKYYLVNIVDYCFAVIVNRIE